jgi:HlyD family secretion protein
MKKSTKILLITVSAVVVCTAAWLLFFKKEAKSTVQVKTEAVQYGDILTTVTATGTIEPVKTVDVGTQVSGIINKIYVDYSSRVHKGQILAELDRSTLQASLVSSQATYESAKNELTYQTSNYQRSKQLYESQSVSKTDFETAEYQYKNAQYSFNNAKSGLEKAQTNLGYATITSPIDGIILSRAVDEGQTVAASFSTPTMFSIAQDLKKMRVIADIDEADIGNVKIGQNVKFTVDAFPDDEFSGKVTMIRLEAQVSSNVVTYEVVIDAPNPDEKLLPGLTASVSIYTQEKHDVLVIPSKAQRVQLTAEMLAQINGETVESSKADQSAGTESAQQPAAAGSSNNSEKTTDTSGKTAAAFAPTEPKISTFGPNTPEGEPNQRTIWVKKTNGKIEQRIIVIGVTDGVSTEVLSGLEKGEEVVTELTMSATSEVVAETETKQATSPFMPQRPGQKTKK